jgi:hypothetical protein
MFQRLYKLNDDAGKNGWSEDLEKEYNSINDKQYQIRTDIEAKIRRLRTGMIPWSPRLQKHRTNIEIWSLLIKKKRQKSKQQKNKKTSKENRHYGGIRPHLATIGR